MTLSPHVDLPALTRRAVKDGGFPAFVRLAWSQVCAEPLVWNWHMEEICTVLEGVARDRRNEVTREVALCVPPATSKSLISSVLFQPWVWTWWPESQWISCTYEQSLASDLSGISRGLVKSDWYQSLWPLGLTRDADSYWVNACGGWRRAVGTGGAITGKHGHFHLGDDLIKEQDSRQGTAMMIASTMSKANGFWFLTMSTRKVAQALARLLVGQRLHVDDPPGKAINEHGYEAIVFPMEYDPDRADPRDHRTERGELLCEARIDRGGVDKLARTLGPSGAKAQLQQDPAPVGGQLIKEVYLAQRYKLLPGRLRGWLEGERDDVQGIICGIYGDATFKGKATSDFVVYQCWAAYLGEYYIVDQVRGQWGFLEAKRQLLDFAAAHRKASYVKLEDAANAPAMVEDMRREVKGLQLAPMAGGCLARQQQVEGIWASGVVHLPDDAPWMGGSDGFVAEHLAYDGLGTRHDDQVATSGLALLDLSGGSTASYNDAWAAVVAQQ